MKQRNQHHHSRHTNTRCEELEEELLSRNSRLEKYEEKLDEFLSGSEATLNEISNVTGYINTLKKEIDQLENEQRKLGCLQEDRLSVSFDNQTIISTSTVRRKTNADLTKTSSSALR